LSVKAGGKVPTRTDESGRETPISTSYEALMASDAEMRRIALSRARRSR
jgi:hypothetical protein